MAAAGGAGLTPGRELAGRRVAVTGAGGFIGRHVVRRLAAAGAQVVGLGTPSRPAATGEGIVRRDDAALETGGRALREALAGCDSIVDLAYAPPVTAGADAVREERSANLPRARALLEAARTCGVRHLSFASSTSVYAAEVGIDESAALDPGSPYAAVKLEQEAEIAGWASLPGRTAAILRLSTVYGPGEPARRAIPLFIESVLAGAPPVVAGDGRGPFDPVYVGDVAEAFLRTVLGEVSGTFNIGTGVAHAPIEVAQLVVQVLGRRIPVVRNRWAEDRSRPICEVRLARAVLGFEARTPLQAGIAAEAAWARSG